MKSNLQILFCALLSGILLSLSIPNELFLTGYPIAAFVAIIPYYIAIKNCKSYKQAFFTGFIQTITTHLISSYWLAFFKDFAVFTLGASALGTTIFGSLAALILYLPYSRDGKSPLQNNQLFKPFYAARVFRIFFFTAGYIFYEYIKSTGFLGYPWGTIPVAMYNFPILMQIASITGTYGITFLVVLFNCLLCEYTEDLILFKNTYSTEYYKNSPLKSFQFFYIHHPLRESLQLFIMLFSLSMCYGIYQYYIPRTPIKQLTTIMVQQNDDAWLPPDDYRIIPASEKLTQKQAEILSLEEKKPQLVVWSEGSLQRNLPSSINVYEYTPDNTPLLPFIRKIGAPFILGGATTKEYTNHNGEIKKKHYNSAHIFNSKGVYLGSYAKLHLVPFAELIPGMDIPFINNIMKKIVGISAGWSKGEHLTYFELPCTSLVNEEQLLVQNIRVNDNPETDKNTYVKVAVPICYDDAFPDTIRPLFNNGAELFINITDDSWSLQKSSEYQHFVIASYRAIEYRTSFVRSTNAGVSCVLDPTAKILYSLPLFESCAMTVNVPVYSRQNTTYAVFGNWLCKCSILVIFLTVIYFFVTFKKSDFIPGQKKIRINFKNEN